MSTLEEYQRWLNSCSEEDIKEELQYVLADVEELEWRQSMGIDIIGMHSCISDGNIVFYPQS